MSLKSFNKYSYELLKYLNLKDKLYSLDEIKKALILKNTDPNLDTRRFILLDNEGNILFGIKNIKMRIIVLMSIISAQFLIVVNKPTSDYFEYNQVPINVSKIF